tara:strand:+ start:195 stop:383 length:189 start_codon:yes stop_codon:yes gene_type:complete
MKDKTLEELRQEMKAAISYADTAYAADEVADAAYAAARAAYAAARDARAAAYDAYYKKLRGE